MRLTKALLAAGLLAVCCVLQPVQFQATARAAEESEEAKASIRAFVEKIDEAAMSFFADDSVDEARVRVRALLASSFDLQGMAEYALARTWERANPEQREELLAAFTEDIVTAFLRRMRAPGTKLEFIGHRKPVGEDHLAASRRTAPGKADQIWIWWLRKDGPSWRVTDLSVDGHSALSSQRQEYGSVYIDNNEDIGAVIAFMRTRAARPIEAE